MRLRTRMGWSFGQVGKINNLRTLNHLGIAVVTDKVTLRTLQKKGVNYAKAWLNHSFIFPDLVLCGKGFTLDVTTRVVHNCTIFLCSLDVRNIDDQCRGPNIKEKDHIAG